MLKDSISAYKYVRCLIVAGILSPAGILGAADPSATVVGAYSNRVVTGEHSAGYSIQLWKEGAQYFGFFISSSGLAEDLPLGVLDSLRYDPDTRALSFQARLSIGVATVDGQSWVPTRDVYQFSGTLFPKQIAGSLIHLNALVPERRGTQEEVKLYRAPEEEAAMPKPASYNDWTELARRLLEARGPKW